MSQLQVTARSGIHAGKLEELEEVAARCMESARTRDSGALQCDCFFDADATAALAPDRW